MISKIEAVNYRCLRDVSQPLDRFHVLAGPNGSGKSTFLEVVNVLRAFADDGLDAVFAESRARQIFAGLRAWYPDPSVLVGQRIVVVANLKPAKLMRVESKGMLLAATSGKDLFVVEVPKEAQGGGKVK